MRLVAGAVVGATLGTQICAGVGHADVPLGPRCPALYVLGVQGPEEGVSVTGDTGALGQLFTPLLAGSGNLVQRAYIDYEQAYGTAEQPFEHAVATATQRIQDAAVEIVSRCPATRIAAAGYGQGAAAVADFAHQVGRGNGGLAADAVAAIALFANPDRAPGPVLPGRPGQTTPAPVPGTAGTTVSGISLTMPATAGSGIGQSGITATDYGALAGRVADFCTAGDLSCDAPGTDAPLTRALRNIASQSKSGDPVAAISTAAEALAATAWTTAVGVITEDLSGTSLDQLSYTPTKSLGQRLAEASDPATEKPGPDQALAALMKLGTIGLGSVVSVARKVITPATIGELATVGMSNPLGAIAVLGTKIAGAVAELIPPRTALTWVNQAFDAIRSTLSTDNDLYELAARSRYSDTDGRHTAYTTAAATPAGQSPLRAAADWFAAVARDIDATHPATYTPRPATTSTPGFPAQSSAGATTTPTAPTG
ncbi:cutinase family protein [Nocardia sp. NPDC003482]